MTRYHKALGMFLVTVFGLWGCARGPATASGSASNEKTKALEVKSARLEDDLKNTAAARDDIRRKLQDSEETMTLLQQEIDRLHSVVKERDGLKGDLATRTTERDQLQVQYDGFRKNIKELLGQAEVTLKAPAPGINKLVSRERPAGDGN